MAVGLSGLHGRSLRSRKTGRGAVAEPQQRQGSWRPLSRGTPYLTTARTESAGTGGSSSSSEPLWRIRATFTRPRKFRLCLQRHYSFSNRCLLFSRSDKSRSTTWLHPRSGEPVNSGHMIRSGRRRSLRFAGFLRGSRRADCCCSVVVQCVLLIDLPRGWEEGFTEEGASYFIKWALFFLLLRLVVREIILRTAGCSALKFLCVDWVLSLCLMLDPYWFSKHFFI